MALKDLGVPGVVTGCLTAGGEVDEQRTAELLRLARPMSFTFHRAFDMVRDPVQALEGLIKLGVDRLLTSGQRGTAVEGLANLKHLGLVANGRIIVMPCGSIRAANVGQVCRETGLWELHFAAHKSESSAMTYRNPQVAMGLTEQDHEYVKTVTDPTTVRSMVEAARREFLI
jgi:copper homeostasis protein